MSRPNSLSLFALVLAVLLPLTATAQGIALVGGTLLDGSTAAPLPDSVVLILDSNIQAVGTVTTLRIPEGYLVISTEGMTLLPGLWDTAVHLLYDGHPDLDHWLYSYPDRAAEDIMPANISQLLHAGVTGVRDTGATLRDVLQVQQSINHGVLPGPKLFVSGPVLVPTKGPVRPNMIAVDGEQAAIAQTKALIEMGVDLIRVAGADANDQDEMDAIVKTAHKAGLRVVSSAHSDIEIRTALRSGVDELQHIGTDSLLYPEDILDMIRERTLNGPALYWNPAVGQMLNASALALDHEWLDDPANFAGLPHDIELDVRQAINQHQYVVPAPEIIITLKRKLKQLQDAGVLFVFGSDSGRFGQPSAQATWRELNTWVSQLGMDPQTAVRWATADAADYIGMGNITGTLKSGMKADVIAVKGNLLMDFSALQDPALVIRHGVRYR